MPGWRRYFSGVVQLRAVRSIRVRGNSRSYAATAAINKYWKGASVESAAPYNTCPGVYFFGGGEALEAERGGTVLGGT